MNSTGVVFTRQELYDLVWSLPAVRIGRKYGFTDAALYKACKKYRIPKPPRGYWAKLKHGHNVKRKELPPASEGIEGPISILGEGRAYKAEERHAAATVPHFADLPGSNAKLHPIAERLRESAKSLQKDETGFVDCAVVGFKHFKFTLKVLPRVVKSLHALITILEANGVHSVLEEGLDRGFRLEKSGQRLEISIEENIDRREATVSEKEKQRYWYRPSYTYHPNGKLSLSINYFDSMGGRRTWNEGKRQQIGWIIPRLAERVIETLNWKIEREKEREAQRQIEIEKAKQANHERWIQKHQSEIVSNLQTATFWHTQTTNTLNYIAHCETTWKQRQSGRLTREQALWLSWAAQEAHKLSPFAYGYPNTSADYPINYEAIPVGGPYPETTKLPEKAKSEIAPKPESRNALEAPRRDYQYPYWLKYQ